MEESELQATQSTAQDRPTVTEEHPDGQAVDPSTEAESETANTAPPSSAAAANELAAGLVKVKLADGGEDEIWIDQEFRASLRPQTEQERALMEENLSSHPFIILTVWRRDDRKYLLDGHHGLAFALRNKRPVDHVRTIKLKDRKAALLWIRDNQAGRRNWTREEAVYYLGSLYNEMKQPQGGDHRSAEFKCQESALEDCKALAAQFNLSSTTIRNAAEFATAVDRITEACGTEIRQRILSGDSGLTRKHVVGLAWQHTDLAALHDAVKDRLDVASAEAKGVKIPAKKPGMSDATEAETKSPASSKVTTSVNLCRQLFKHVDSKPKALACAVFKALGLEKAKAMHRELGELLKAPDKKRRAGKGPVNQKRVATSGRSSKPGKRSTRRSNVA